LPVAGVLLVLAIVAVVLGATREPGFSMFLLCVLAAVLAAAGGTLLIWALAYRRLAYALTESALRVEWLGQTVVVPYAAIQGIYTGQRLQGSATPEVPCWPGINVGSARVRGLGRLRFFATSTDQSLLTLITVEHGGVVISARDPNEFRTALIDSVERFGDVSADEAQTWQSRGPTEAPWTAIADGWLPATVALGTLALLVVLGSICMQYDGLPDQIPLHFDVGGQPNQIASKSDLLRLPWLGLLVLVVNWALGIFVHPRERLLARVLWLTGVVVQFILFVGILDVLRLAA
jgi:hypothetical protein